MLPLRNIKRFLNKTIKQPLYAARIAEKRLGAYFSYCFWNGCAMPPEAITLFLTHRCNLRCRMCGQWGDHGVTKKAETESLRKESRLDELKIFIDDVAKFKPNITLFGGEPLLFDGVAELIEYIKKKGMHVIIITNGFLVEELAPKLVAAGLDELNVSLDGTKEVHDQIRGLPGLFDKIIAGLKKVRDIKSRDAKRKPFVNLQCTMTQYNYRQLSGMLDVARESDADSLTFHNLIFLDESVLGRQAHFDEMLGCLSGGWKGFVFEPGIDVDILWEEMNNIKKNSKGLAIDFYPNFGYNELKNYYSNPSYAPAGNTGICLSPWIAGYVFPDGEVRPCLNSTYSYGRLGRRRFLDIWNSAEAIKFRRLLKKTAAFPVCARCTELYRY